MNENEKKIQGNEDEQLNTADLLKVQGCAGGLRGTVKTETQPISSNTIDKS